MSRIHAIMNGTAPLNSLQIHEKGHLLANSPSAASLSRRLSQVQIRTLPYPVDCRLYSVWTHGDTCSSSQTLAFT